MRSAPMIGTFAAALAATLLSPAASAQNQPANPPFPAGTTLERYDPHEWTLEATVNVRAWRTTDPSTKLPVIEKFEIDTAAIVFPLIQQTAGHAAKDPTESELRVNDVVIPTSYEFMTGYHSGTRLGKWRLMDWSGDEVQLKVKIATTCFKTRFNEAAAEAIEWPKGDWPPEAASTFDPQFYVNIGPPDKGYDMEPIRELVKVWTNGKDPKSIKPVTLAKYFAGEVWELAQPSGNGLGFNRLGQLEGIDLQGAPVTARRRRGSEFDIVCLLAAVYREAGLPARTVIGLDIGEREDLNRRTIFESKGSPKLRAWVEFALYDESRGQVQWVPVDVVRMRKNTSRPPALDKPWPYFGTHDELDCIIPFAFQFHPPTTVRAYGSPGFWGWMVTPKPPERAVQALTFRAQFTPRTSGQNPPGRR